MFLPFGNQMENIPTIGCFLPVLWEDTLRLLHSLEPILAPGLSTGLSEPAFSKKACFFLSQETADQFKEVYFETLNKLWSTRNTIGKGECHIFSIFLMKKKGKRWSRLTEAPKSKWPSLDHDHPATWALNRSGKGELRWIPGVITADYLRCLKSSLRTQSWLWTVWTMILTISVLSL